MVKNKKWKILLIIGLFVIILGLLASIVGVNMFSTVLKDISRSEKYLYFTTENDVYWRISNEGDFGWRLQLSKNGYDYFDDKGAAQSLAEYMEEELNNEPDKLKIKRTKDEMVLTAQDGSSAVLHLKDVFSLEFISPEGKCITYITNADSYEEGKLTITGKLQKEEAIYGGGERFDTVNKRGKSFELYTSDGWDNSQTTYVVQPLFLTTNGGGMFFNRYEPAVVDFGSYDTDLWNYIHNGDLLDCYFYPTGDMNSAITSCTKLTGNATVPSEWMQGVQVCRYYPDFKYLDKDLGYEDFESIPNKEKIYVKQDNQYIHLTALSEENQKKEIYLYKYNSRTDSYSIFCFKDPSGRYRTLGKKGNPGGDSCKTIIENYISRGLKPDAAIIECYDWKKYFANTFSGQGAQDSLEDIIQWFHAQDIKVMLYMRLGEVPQMVDGFKWEYLVHADVEIEYSYGKETQENTTDIPYIIGTGENPDVKTSSSGIKTETYLDITNPEAVDWYFDTIWGRMIEMGVDGVKIDFCEVMPDSGKQCGITKTDYHWKNPRVFASGTEHHAYPSYFISAFTKRMNELKRKQGDEDGFMVFSRGGGIGSQRNPYLWAGDQSRSFDKLAQQLKATVNSGLSAIPFMSYDMAGYSYNGVNYFTMPVETESEIFARAIEFTAFTTNIQTHGDVRHMYEMTSQVQEIYKNFVNLHYELLPYIQKYSKIASKTGVPPVRHLSLNFPDDSAVYSIEDQFMLGDGLLIAPILTEQTFSRQVYLPKGKWKNLLTDEVIEGGVTVTAAAGLGQIPVFLNLDSEDTQELSNVFSGDIWNRIKG